ncbi:MAG: hypothetical protein WCA83_10765 [Azonexus sp.]
MHDHIIFPSYSSDPYLLLLVILLFGAVTLILKNATLLLLTSGEEPPLGRNPLFVYRSSRRHGIELVTEIWPSIDPVASFNLSVAVSVPQESGCYPLIVYLPPPTELAAFAHELRLSWVKAGYAVVMAAQEQPMSSPQGKPAANIDDEYVCRIHGLLGHLEKRQAPPFDRINFKTTVFAGYGSGAHTARALANVFSSETCSTLQTGSLQRLMIHEPHASKLAIANDSAALPSGDLAIFIPKEGDRGITLRYASYAQLDKTPGRRCSDSNISHITATRHLSLGFLDANVKMDPTAIEWLERDAGRWLEPVGKLQHA